MKPNTTEFPFLYCLGWHLRKQQKIKAKNSSKKSIWKPEIEQFLRHAKKFDPYIYDRREMEVVNQKDEKNKPII